MKFLMYGITNTYGKLGMCESGMAIGRNRQLSGPVVERWPAALKAGVQTQVGEPKNFQYRLSSAETQQPVDRMRRKARGCLVLSVLC